MKVISYEVYTLNTPYVFIDEASNENIYKSLQKVFTLEEYGDVTIKIKNNVKKCIGHKMARYNIQLSLPTVYTDIFGEDHMHTTRNVCIKLIKAIPDECLDKGLPPHITILYIDKVILDTRDLEEELK